MYLWLCYFPVGVTRNRRLGHLVCIWEIEMNYLLRAFIKTKRTTCNSECIVMLFLKISLLKQFRANFYMCWLVTYIVTWCPCYSCCQHSIIYIELAQDVTICSWFVYQWGVWLFPTSCATWLFNPKLFSSFPKGFSREMNGYYKPWNFLQIFHLLWFMGLGIIPICFNQSKVSFSWKSSPI
jgi:hypothetical protein